MHISAHARFFVNHPPDKQLQPKVDRKLEEPFIVDAIGERSEHEGSRRRNDQRFASTEHMEEQLDLYERSSIVGQHAAAIDAVATQKGDTGHISSEEAPGHTERSVFDLLERIVSTAQEGA